MENVVIKNKAIQLEIWAIPFDEDQMKWHEVQKLQQTVKNVRRGLFQRFNQLADKVAALEEELTYMKDEKLRLVG